MEFCWKFYGSIEFKIVSFGLMLSLSALHGVKSNCKYQELEVGQKYYVYNNEYPQLYRDKNHYCWEMTSSYNVKINCSIDMGDDCFQNSLSIQFVTNNRFNYCGYNSFILEGINPTITFDSQLNTQGRFLCEIQALKQIDNNNCRCGWKKVTRIVGGEETGINEYPMMCGLVDFKKEIIYCGCTIISNQYVITAAHCTDKINTNNNGVVVGEHDVTTGRDTNVTKIFRIIKCLQHPGYDVNNAYNAYNDVAVCEIDGTIKYSAEVGPVCLPFQHKRDSFGGSIVTALGWGLLEYAGSKSTVLRKVNLNVINPRECKSIYHDISDDNICTFTWGKDACQMDSGGPLLWHNPTTDRCLLIGIISAGVGCASKDPAVAMRTGAFIDWIVSVTPGVRYCQVE